MQGKAARREERCAGEAPPPAGASANRNARAGRAVRPRKPRPYPNVRQSQHAVRPGAPSWFCDSRPSGAFRGRCILEEGERPEMPGGGRSRGPKVGCGLVGAVSLVSYVGVSARHVWRALGWWKFVEWTPPASGRLPGERGSLPWGNDMAGASLVFRVSAWSNHDSGVGGLGDLRPCCDASPAPVVEKKPVLTPCWNCFCDLLFVAFVIIIMLNTLPQRILLLYLTVN